MSGVLRPIRKGIKPRPGLKEHAAGTKETNNLIWPIAGLVHTRPPDGSEPAGQLPSSTGERPAKPSRDDIKPSANRGQFPVRSRHTAANRIAGGVGPARMPKRRFTAYRASFPASDIEMQEGAVRDGYDIRELDHDRTEEANLPPFASAIAPVVAVVLVNLIFVQFVVPAMDTAYLSEPEFGSTDIDAVRGLWAIIVALLVAILLIVALNWSRLKSIRTSLDEGANASVLPIANTASLVGFGAVIAALPAFQMISDALLSLGDANPLLSLAIAVNVLSAVTGSASGGMSIALDVLGPTYVKLAETHNISLEAMHRISSISSGALDTLPHNGAVITVLSICKLDHRQSYGDVFVVAIIGPMIALACIILLASVFGSF